METPVHERRQIEDYLCSQSGDDFEIEHVEKLTSEYVLGHQYDVWDAHTSDGRWWVITNPVNLYSQDQIKSMDVALSFHICLMSRVMNREPLRARRQDAWVLEVIRRLDVAAESLDRAKEVEDFQAVGMRLRETLLTLAAKLAGLGSNTGGGHRPAEGQLQGVGQRVRRVGRRGQQRAAPARAAEVAKREDLELCRLVDPCPRRRPIRCPDRPVGGEPDHRGVHRRGETAAAWRTTAVPGLRVLSAPDRL